MKKLKLKLAGKQMLSKEQMKSVNGGYGGDCPENWTPTIKCVFSDGQFAGWMFLYANSSCSYSSYWDDLCDSWYTGANEICTGNPGVGTAKSDQVTCVCTSNYPYPC